MADIDNNPSSMGPIFGVWMGRSYLEEVPSYDVSCALIILIGLYG